MSVNIEDYVPVVKYEGLNTDTAATYTAGMYVLRTYGHALLT